MRILKTYRHKKMMVSHTKILKKYGLITLQRMTSFLTKMSINITESKKTLQSQGFFY